MGRLVHWYGVPSYRHTITSAHSHAVTLPYCLTVPLPLGLVPVVYDPFLGGLALAVKIPGVSGTGTNLELYNFLDLVP
jgi:hypothetical protein